MSIIKIAGNAVFLIAAFCGASNCLAQSTPESGRANPFVGTRKENIEKGTLAKTTTTYERQGDKIKASFDDPELNYSFTLDGKETPHAYSTAAKPATFSWKASTIILGSAASQLMTSFTLQVSWSCHPMVKR